MRLKAGTLEEKIVNVLRKRYPITIKELASELNERLDKVKRSLSKLARAGIVSLEPLPEKTYVRLARGDIGFVGIDNKQKRALKHKGGKKKKKEEEDEVDYII